jgi:transposase
MSSHTDYTGKTVYVGIDVHKNSYSVVIICNGEVVKKDHMVACPENLLRYLKNTFREANINTAYEAGFSGFHLHRYLVQNGITNLVVHPAAIEIAARERVKTDKRDALKISIQLASGRLRSIHIPGEEQEANRMVTRLRSTYMKNRNRYASQLKALLFQYGLIEAHDRSVVSKKWIEKILETTMKGSYLPGFKCAIENYAEQWITMTAKVKEIDKQLIEQSRYESWLDDIYQSVPGIGPLSSRILANELGDMSQFSNEKKLFSFTGLTPGEYSSGDKKRLGSISRQGRPILRKILVEAAWVAIRKDKRLENIFSSIVKRAGAKRAIVGVARRLIGCIRACVVKKEVYKLAVAT